jgi:hypothetical protein
VSERTAWVLGIAVAAAFLGAHVLSWYAVHTSSTGGMAYLTLPFVLLLLTIVSTSICDAASRHEPTDDRRGEMDEVSAMARDLARRDARRAARARR